MLAVLASPSEPADQLVSHPQDDVALGRTYALSPRPSYPLTTDRGDDVQLTDGKRAGGGFWSEKSAVGWVGVRVVTITVDLGAELQVSGASISAAAGSRGEVEWPSAALVLASLDGTRYSLLGDLVALDAAAGNAPPPSAFGRHVFESRSLSGQARYVRLVIGVSGPYLFLDEVEVFGRPAVATSTTPSDATTDTDGLYWRVRAAPRLRGEVERRLGEAKAQLAAARVAPAEREGMLTELAALQQGITRLTHDDWARVNKQYPMNAAHAAALAMIGELERRAGAPVLRAWPANCWDPLDLTTAPPPDGRPSSVDVALMNGEVRSGALNLRNSSAGPIVATIALDEVEALEPGWVEARAVAWSGDAQGRAVALALLPPTPVSAAAVVTVPAGVTQQVWFTFSPTRAPAGLHERFIRVSTPGAPDVRVAVKARILPGQFPLKSRLHLGGWDYVNDGGPVAPPAARAEIASVLRRYGVDVPWATAAVMPFGSFDASGRLLAPPSTTVFDAWITLWPGASRYRVYISSRGDIAGIRRDSPAFPTAVRSWSTFWAAHLTGLGIRPEDVDLLFVDEPYGVREEEERQVAWARALKAGGAGFRVWIDPLYRDPGAIPRALLDTTDILCLGRALAEKQPAAYRALAERQRNRGLAVEFFSTAGPSSSMDPYGHFRLQAWLAFDFGATAESFWSFTDTGGASSWREYLTRGSLSTLFIDGASILPSKQLAAIREGVEDYEYLAMLRDAIAKETPRRPPDDPTLKRARSVLRAGVARVLESCRPDTYLWNSVRDRTVADTVRLELAEELQLISPAPPPSP